MAKQRLTKLNWLERHFPEGLVADARWLTRHGYSTSLRSQYVAAGWLEQPARGVYRRPRGSLAWQQVVISLQALLEYPLLVGGRTALELQGYAHYLSRELKEVHLYGPKPPPQWLHKLPLQARFVYHNDRKLFRGEPLAKGLTHLDTPKDQSTRNRAAHGFWTVQPWGQWDWPLALSTPERAVLELLDELPKRESFHQADMLMQGLSNLSPRRLQKLLGDCRSVKVKRLFFFFADRHRHAWLKRLDKRAADLGHGKRMLAKGGKLDKTYQITVPENLDAVR
jgi:Transcriptional regulator, AbiEi antitoxin, Type IV TA system/Transcriptional regulator, AbiEi antitoxin N-terminal domain